MIFHAIDTLFIAVPDSTAIACYERLGLRLSSDAHGRVCRIGAGPHAVSAEFLTPGTIHPLPPPIQASNGLIAVGLRVPDLAEAVRQLASRGVEAVVAPGMAWLPLHERAGANVVLLPDERKSEGAAGHSFPLKRLDHLAAVTHDLEEKTRFWVQVLGVPQTGEVRTPTLIVRQFRIGDAILELLGAASPDSPIHKRPAGLVSLASWEVLDLDRVVQQARAAGFAPSEPATGVLPGTRTATIQAGELGGVVMQLLQYVGTSG